MITIPLTKGYTAIVDDADKDLADLHWSAHIKKKANTTYASHGHKGKFCHPSMHRIILERMLGRDLLATEICDHRDGNGLNNTRSNLRLATVAQNLMNQRRRCNNQSGFKGIWLVKQTGKYRSGFRCNGERIYAGYFDTAIEAHRAYCIAALTYHGEFANFGSNSPFKGWTLADFD